MLENSLGFLTGGGRTVVPRQRTLRGALDWSYDLLGESERILFRRLSVFAGGWTLEAAETIGSGDSVAKVDVLDLLSRLVDKSLVVTKITVDRQMRYGILEPVRQYARDKLEGSGEEKARLRLHAKFFLELAEEAHTKMGGPEAAAWSAHLEADHDNLRAALSWTLEQGEADTSLRLAGALAWFWKVQGYASEAVEWLDEALAVDGATPRARAVALLGMGDILRRSDLERSQACLEESVALYRGLGNLERIAESLMSLGWVVYFRGDASRAEALFEESLATARKAGDQLLIGAVFNSLALTALESQDLRRAQELWREALTLYRRSGSDEDEPGILLNMGYAELAFGDGQRASVLLEEALVLGRKIGDKPLEAASLTSLGIAALLRGEPEQATALLKDGLAMHAKMGRKIDIAEDLEGLAETAGALSQHFRAAQLWGAARALREAIGVFWSSAERMLHEPWLIAARSRLDAAVWEAAFAKGGAMELEEALGYALSEEEHILPTAPASEQSPAGMQPATLSRREEEVAAMVAQGMTNRQIAQQLFLSERTIEKHVSKILRKLELNTRTEIASWATQQRLIALEPD